MGKDECNKTGKFEDWHYVSCDSQNEILVCHIEIRSIYVILYVSRSIVSHMLVLFVDVPTENGSYSVLKTKVPQTKVKVILDLVRVNGNSKVLGKS